MTVNVDLSFMYDHNAVVHCKTREEANELIDAVVRMFPRDKNRDRAWRNCWDNHKDKTCYRFNLYENRIDFGYCYESYYQRNGSRIIEYAELTGIIDHGEIETGFDGIADALSVLF